MAQATTAPNAGMKAGQSSSAQQVSLRDHLNERIAPFLKKAMIASLKVEPEFPLQYLGEYLINESIKYENNHDSANIKAHFRYHFADHSSDTNGTVQTDVPAANGDAVATEETTVQTQENEAGQVGGEETGGHQDTEMAG